MRAVTFWQLLPALVVFLYFVVGLAAFSARAVLRGIPHDREIEARGQSLFINFYFRNFFVWIVSPLWRVLLASRVRAHTVTGIAAGLGASSGVAVACGASRSAAGSISSRGSSTRSTGGWRARTARRPPAARSSTRCSTATPTR